MKNTDNYLVTIPEKIQKQKDAKIIQEMRRKELEKKQIASELYNKALTLYKSKTV